MFGNKKTEPGDGAFLAAEAEEVRHLDARAYEWLGDHYRWYDKVRKAKKGEGGLFQDPSLEEQMLATRSSLSLVTQTLHSGLVLAYNSVVESVGHSGHAPQGWPAPLAMPDRNNPPASGPREDALIIAFQPLKFLNLAKAVRDKGKGVPFYSDNLIKKLWFKVIGYYCDPGHWDVQRLSSLVSNIPQDAPAADLVNRLSGLRSEVEILSNTHQLFKFGRSRSGRADPTAKNTVEDLYNFTDAELVADLYLQHFVLLGLDHFLFRYYLTLMAGSSNTRLTRMLSHIFRPLLQKSEEVRQQFQTSFFMERDKVRLRNEFHEYSKAMEGKPLFEPAAAKGGPERKVNYSHHLLESVAFSRSAQLSPAHRETWSALLRDEVLARLEGHKGHAFLLEVLNTLVSGTQQSVEGRIKAAQALRDFANEQERLAMAQIKQKRRQLEEQKRKILRKANTFKAEKRFDVVKAYEDKAAQLEAEAKQQLDAAEAGITKRREAHLARVEHLEQAAREEGEHNTGRSAAAIYELACELDTQKQLRAGLLPYLAQHIQEEKDESYHTLYRFIFGVLTDLTPVEKVVLRKQVSGRMKLEDHELAVSEQELKEYQGHIVTWKTELNMEVPGVLEHRLIHGAVNFKVDELLDMGLTEPSLRLLLQMPIGLPNKPPGKLPAASLDKVLTLNRMIHPLPEHDLVLPNVEADAPPAKRINFNRLGKLK
jgi:hypothetical protein